jgi:hypothetical protein
MANLASERGENVIVVDPRLAPLLNGSMTISAAIRSQGDATDISLLKKMPISRPPAKSPFALEMITSIFS